ncbi:MAG: bifunctional 2-C-methyl-D-erythritol 4-phosphate cytidylyltransferase/2-C-methyl-D-erythritol 2,4-cyclodiphosphate synthase [Campylobacteraceae bacterium]|nr:bifunctional 2-C-methyl-D-erythritol 4-phosphate cytidylyltransferase/2-C-methyl-D-erythritol 2,4-cyclodiphosphate synthase [Campylobacteraceae bacterium]
MTDVTLIVLCAGTSSRFEHRIKKQWLRINNEPLWLNVTKRISSYCEFKKVIVTSHPNELNYMKNFSSNICFVEGGETRQESMKNALEEVDSEYVMVTDVARAGVPKAIILDLLNNKNKAACIVPILDVSDTVIFNEETIDRKHVKLIQTPQLSNTSILRKALKNTQDFTDDSSAIKNINESVFYIKGSYSSKKLTFLSDLNEFDYLKGPCKNTFIGSGIDIHAYEENKEMYLGGVKLPCSYGFKAHSDGDVLIHSVIDALLGAIGAGDIGEFFPDNDPQYKNANSASLLSFILDFVTSVGYEIINIDLTILAEIPKINPHKLDIKFSMAKLLNIEPQFINIKATTSEKMGFVGRKEGLTVLSTANLKYYDWKNT